MSEPSKPKHILLVEDHADSAWAVSRALRSLGHEVMIAQDLATARRIANSAPLDLLICDLSLPDGSGLDLLAELRARGIAIPAVALSGHGYDEDIRQSHAAGFAVHLLKPVTLDQLSTAIELACGK